MSENGTSNAPRTTALIGEPINRVDGKLKATGGARYAAEFPVDRVAHGVLIQSAIAKGRIVDIDTSAAEAAPGVVLVMTYKNAPRVSEAKPGPGDKKLFLLQENDVHFNRENIGVVVAETFTQALGAASLVRVVYEAEKPQPAMEPGMPEIQPSQPAPPQQGRPQAQPGGQQPGNVSNQLSSGGQQPSGQQPGGQQSGGQHPGGQQEGGGGEQRSQNGGQTPNYQRGDVDAGLAAAAVRVEGTYSSPVETHNPMEPHATTAVWEGDHLTIYDSTQGIFQDARRVAGAFQIPEANVRCICYFTGGGFGCKGSTWSHVVLTAMAARMAGRPVRLALERPQMFGPVGFRPHTVQHLALGADGDGRLTAIRHHSVNQVSTFDEFVERTSPFIEEIYRCPNVSSATRVVRVDAGTPTYMRAPGESTGSFALETAMDELAYAARIDPLELRLRNYADVDPASGKPWSSKSLGECYRQAAERFGWSNRSPEPRSMTSNGRLVGWGMATASYPTHRSEAQARVQLFADGTLLAMSGSQDIGTGTYTVMTQVAAEGMGLPIDRVRFELGDTEMPESPNSGGSQTAASVGSAVYLAAQVLRDRVISLAIADPASPLSGRKPAEIAAGDGRIFLKANPARGELFSDLLKRHNIPMMEQVVEAKPGDETRRFAMRAFGAQFAEVQVDPDLGEIRATRWAACFAAGRMLNAKTAHSQLMGGIVFGIGMGLMEETLTDPRSGRVVNADLSEYLVPVNADVPDMDISFIQEEDPYVNPIGVKGIGEIGITGVAAALSNAVFHATGKRVRDLPITLDKVI